VAIVGFSDEKQLTVKEIKSIKSTSSTLNAELMGGLYEGNSALPESWYQTYPYRFRIVKTSDNNSNALVYSLPIPPESIVVRPVYASEAIPTMGGVVEETSPVVFWNITISGTMPHSVQRTGMDAPAKQFRQNVSSTGPLSSIVGNILKPIENLANRFDNVTGAFSNGFSVKAASDASQALLQPPLPYSKSAVVDNEGNASNNGFSEIHYMQKFFLLYQKLSTRFGTKFKEGSLADSKYALAFDNVKDGQTFRVIIKDSVFSKTAASPYTYKYQITMQGWGLESAKAENAINRFGAGGDLATVNTTTITSLVNGAKNGLKFLKRGATDPLGTFVSTPPVL
jgi:hypothetical protein